MPIHLRWMAPDEIDKLKEIDRSEKIRTGYRFTKGELIQLDVNWDSPPWGLEEDGEFSVAAEIRFCQGHFDRGGRLYGAFEEDNLVGIGLLQPNIAPKMAQLAYLHVSKLHRQHGIGQRIAQALFEEAKKSEADKMYVSAVPSGSAVGFYMSQGFAPTDSPIPALFELEPEDIHMVKQL